MTYLTYLLHVSRDGKELLSVGSDGVIRVLGEEVYKIDGNTTEAIKAVVESYLRR